MYEKQVLSLVESLEKVKVTLLKATIKTPETVAAWLERSVIPYLNRKVRELTGPPNLAYRRVLQGLLNNTTSLLEGLRSGDADLADAVSIGRDYEMGIAKIEVIREEFENKVRDTHIRNGGDPMVVPKVLLNDQNKGRDPWATMTDEGHAVLKKYSQWALDLPKNLKKEPFIIRRVPVVPLMPSGANIDVLRKLKLAVDHVAYYPILLNQQVLGLNSHWVADNFRGKGEKAADFVVNLLEDKTGQKFLITGEPLSLGDGLPRKLGGSAVLWYWIPTVKDVEKLRKAAYGQKMSIQRWGFPFRA